MPKRLICLTTLAALLATAAPAAAAKRKSCTRGGAKIEAATKDVRVVRRALKREHAAQSRREQLLACWVRTGKRVGIAEEVDLGEDNIARTDVEIVGNRYVGVLEENEGGVSIARSARIFDARTRKLLHDSEACEQIDRGDLAGVDDVVFLEGGGMAMSCGRLFLFRRAGSPIETLEPEGTDVRQVAVSYETYGFNPRLFWTIVTAEGEVTKSLAL